MRSKANRAKIGKADEELSNDSDSLADVMKQAEGGEGTPADKAKKGTPADDDEEEEAQKKPIVYRSRNTFRYDIEDSQEEGSGGEEGPDPTLSKTSLAYLTQEKKKLEQLMDRNAQMVEVEEQKKALGANSDSDIKPNKRFKNFNDVFSGLTRSKNVLTAHPIISCIMTYNSKSAITVMKASDREYWIKQYSLETNQQTFEEKVGSMSEKEIKDPEGFFNGREPYIKLKEVKQNSNGTKFAFVYLDDGRYRLRTFSEDDFEDMEKAKPPRDGRTKQQIMDDELDINKELKLDFDTMPINNFPDPFITCCFVDDDIIFVNLFHNSDLTHYHFFFDKKKRQISQITKIQIEDCNSKNFPYDCFYNSEFNEIYSFYRQGHSYRIPCKAVQNEMTDTMKDDAFAYEKIYDKDLGQMFLINEKALIARSSSQILFFKLELDEFTKEKYWHNYHTLDQGGSIYFIKGNKRIQVCTDSQIFFYLIDPRTFEPTLENVMFNFMNCSMMMFGSKVKYGITYKTNQKSFDVYRRKFEHDFRVTTVEYDLDGSRGLPIEDMNAFLVTRGDRIEFYDIDTYKEIQECEIIIPLLKTEEREPNEIISMQVSQNKQILAVISGKNLIMNEQKPNQLFIFQRVKNLNAEGSIDKFVLLKSIKIQDNPAYDSICMQFRFKCTKHGRDPTHIFFAKEESIMELNFDTEETRELVILKEPLSRQPEFFYMNDDQSVSIIASIDDCIYYHHRTMNFVNLKETYEVSNVKEIIYDIEAQMFYLLANKFKGKLGVFLIKFEEEDPLKYNFFLKYKNKLDIADADIAVMRNEKKKLKELVVSYKSININTYNVYVVDISGNDPWPLFRHESFQLWESQISAFYLEKSKDYVMINRDGISVLSLGSFQKKNVTARNGQAKMIHSLESANYLKVDPNNNLTFQFAGEKKIITVSQQFDKQNSKTGVETGYEDVYKVQIHVITLRELLLFQSLYVCNTQSDILKLVNSQPKPAVFYKSFLELDGTNMVSILSFDSRSMKELLDEKNEEYFQSDFPMFYKNKIQNPDDRDKFFYRSAIDSALRNNQISAVVTIIDYIVKYQNNFVSSFLFLKNFKQLMEKGIHLSPLLNSKIFRYQFDYDEWPSVHVDDNEYLRPYNHSIFQVRDHYRTIFHEKQFEIPDDDAPANDSNKVYKITYELNTIPQIGEYVLVDADGNKQFENEKESLLDMCSESDELEIFCSAAISDVIKFKWDEFALKIHMVGCFFHFFYMTILIIYINAIYINNDQENAQFFAALLMFGIVYPTWYDFTQLKKQGIADYFSEFQNYSDQLYIWCSIANVISQNTSNIIAKSQGKEGEGPFFFRNKILMTIILIMQILKSFFYLRIFEWLSYIVTMIYTVVADLKVFGLFFTILILLFSMVFAVLGAANEKIPGQFQDDFKAAEEDGELSDMPNSEYQKIGLFFGYIFSTLRVSIGDFDFDGAGYLKPKENMLYWIIWLVVVIVTCIIFLNFIIAEASASYEKVKSALESMINKEKAQLIAEAETMYFESWKGNQVFPKYIVIRKAEI